MNFVTLLISNWKYVAIGLLALALAIQWQLVGAVRKDRDAAVSLSNQLKNELEVSKASVSRLQKSVDDQNHMIENFKVAGDKKFQENKGKLDAAGKQAATIKAEADDILNKQPAKDATACINANNLFNEEIRNAK